MYRHSSLKNFSLHLCVFIRFSITILRHNTSRMILDFLNEFIPLCINSVYLLYCIQFRQHNINVKVIATCFDLTSHLQAYLRTITVQSPRRTTPPRIPHRSFTSITQHTVHTSRARLDDEISTSAAH